MTDLELLDRYRIRGDKTALDRLCERYYSFVLRVCRRQLRNDADADDAAQQVFGHFLSHAPQVHTNVAAWLHRCAHNVSVSLVRSRMARRRTEQAYLEHGAAGHNGDAQGDLLVALDECLATMPEHERELIIQTQLLRVPQRVMAAQRGVSQQAVAKQLARSLDRLRVAISARGIAISAVALAAALEGEASAALFTIGAAATTPHLASTATSTLATTTKLKLLSTAVASVVVLSLPGTSERPPVVAPPPAVVASRQPKDADGFDAIAAKSRAAEVPAALEPRRNIWNNEPAASPPRENRSGAIAMRPIRTVPQPALAPLPPPLVRQQQVTRIEQADPFAPREPRPAWNPPRIAPRWNGDNSKVTVGPLVSNPPAKVTTPLAAPSIVQPTPGNSASTQVDRVKLARAGAAASNPITQPKSRSSSGASAPAGGSVSNAANVNPTGTSVAGAKPPPANQIAISNVLPIRDPATGTFNIYAPPHGSSSIGGAGIGGSGTAIGLPTLDFHSPVHYDVAHGAPPSVSGGYATIPPASSRPMAPPPLQQLSVAGDFILTLNEPRSAPSMDMPQILQLSAPLEISSSSLRMGSATIEADCDTFHVTEEVLIPSDAHDLVALLSGKSNGVDAIRPELAIAIRPEAGYGLSPELLAQVAGETRCMERHGDDEASRTMSIHENFPEAMNVPGMVGDLIAANGDFISGSATDGSAISGGSAMYAMQLSAVPEPAAWQLAVLAAIGTLVVLFARRRRRVRC